MTDTAKYTIFKTKWGYFGLVADKKGLIRTCLPCPTRKTVEKRLLSRLNNLKFDKNLLKPLQDDIVAYFNGRPLSSVFRRLSSVICPLNLTGLATFTRKVLTACGKIPAGRTVSYSQLARMIGKPKAGRAVGNALARNPVPLIIPCHRVIHSDGSPGNFSAPGGVVTKRNLIELEIANHH